MRLALRRRETRTEPVDVLEVVTPRTNVAALTSAENLFAALALSHPFSVDLAADAGSRRFLVRASGEGALQHLQTQLAAAYPQAELRRIPLELDPARLRDSERVAACVLRLRSPAYLPIRSFTDLDIDAQHSAQTDPLLGILGALGDVPPRWRGVSQLVLRPAPDAWSRDFERYSVQHPLEHERLPRATEGPALGIGFVGLLMLVLWLGLQAYSWYQAAQWFELLAAALCTPFVAAGGLRIWRRLRPPVYDMLLVRDKVSRIGYYAELRLAVFAPADVSERALESQLARCAAAYRHFNLAAGNGFQPRQLKCARRDLREPRPVGGRGTRAVLTTRELAGLWHLPHAAEDIALLERTTARRWLPLPDRVADGCRIGVAQHQGRSIPVAIPEDALRRHLLMVAKTRRGKSTLMLRLAHHVMCAEPRRGLLLIDPHRDLAEAALGMVPPHRQNDVVYVDAAECARPIGLNVLDVGLGWTREQAVATTLSVFHREWGDQFWGPRMEDAFRYCLLALCEANAAICRDDPVGGRARQYTLLDIPDLLGNRTVRKEVLRHVSYEPVLQWYDYYEHLDSRFRDEVINPVLTKIHRFSGTSAAHNMVVQPASTVDPSGWIRDGAIVVVHTARGVIGENAAALIGSTLVNLVSLAVADQASLVSEDRRSVTIFVDEFHTIPGADYEGILAELNKFGANLVLATQSLERLATAGGPDGAGRSLRATVFANLDGLFAFNCSAEDARYLVPELGGALDEQDLVELGEHQCYVRISSAGRRLPTFSVSLDRPLESDPTVRARLIAASAERYGRAVETIMSRRARIAAETVPPAPETPQLPESEPEPVPRRRSEHRRRKKTRQPEPVHA